MLKTKLAELEIWYNPAYCLKAVESNGDALQYVPKAFWGLFRHMIDGL